MNASHGNNDNIMYTKLTRRHFFSNIVTARTNFNDDDVVWRYTLWFQRVFVCLCVCSFGARSCFSSGVYFLERVMSGIRSKRGRKTTNIKVRRNFPLFRLFRWFASETVDTPAPHPGRHAPLWTIFWFINFRCTVSTILSPSAASLSWNDWLFINLDVHSRHKTRTILCILCFYRIYYSVQWLCKCVSVLIFTGETENRVLWPF